MGVVYAAEQLDPRREVAIKLIRGGQYVSDRQLRMFRRETQALAHLQHPSIAAMYEAGRTSDGHPFFAMEHVRGSGLGTYKKRLSLEAADHRANLRARLEIFLEVVGAVSYAHQRGVVHRDLKPSNIMVCESSGSGSSGRLRVKLLDFGLAKITDSDLHATTLVSASGQLVGTLAYMSPEQARGDVRHVDLRTDVYSLGAILYELLTDDIPIPVTGLPLPEAVRRICEDEPSRADSKHRSIGGDLDTIARKAMQKEPEHRYQSAAALGEDISRYLADLPILGRPPSASYQVRKLLSRYRLQATFLSSIFVLALASTVVTSILLQGQRRARREAEDAQTAQIERLWEASLEQARSTRMSGQPGRRFDALEAVSVATSIRISPELRRQAIAAMSLTDLHATGPPISTGSFYNNANIGCDGDLGVFADGEDDESIRIRDAGTGDVLRTLRTPCGRLLYTRMDGNGRYVATKCVDDHAAPSWEHEHTFRLWDSVSETVLMETASSSSMAFDLSRDGSGSSSRSSRIASSCFASMGPHSWRDRRLGCKRPDRGAIQPERRPHRSGGR